MNTYSHPFLRGLKQQPEGKEKDLTGIRDWLSTQPHLPSISDEYIYLFLHSNYYDMKATQDTIEYYFTLKTGTPDLFSGRNVGSSRMKVALDITHMVALPYKTSEGYNILVYRFSDTDYTKMNFADLVRMFCMFNDLRLSEDGLSEGYIVIFDMKGCSLGHLTRVSLPALRSFMLYIQDAHPARLKRINVVHTASFINQVMYIVKPFIKGALMSLLHLTSNGPASLIDIELLPSDYGGPLKSLEEFHKEQRELMETSYKDWLIDTETFKVEEKKRIKKPNRGIFASLTGGFKTLEID
ncbi:clavesin-1-like [Arctopsyche grandis]|uniref:clavesin-1-like n=1 Tax=Arctopsyche grandis TaxID=121162 RepID=UPI00406D8AE7